MPLEIIKVHVGYETIDEYGRLGRIIGVYRNAQDAGVGVKGKGWYGSSGRIMERSAIVHGDDLYILEHGMPMQFKDVTEEREKQKQETIKQVMDKLTKEELELLKESFK